MIRIRMGIQKIQEGCADRGGSKGVGRRMPLGSTDIKMEMWTIKGTEV